MSKHAHQQHIYPEETLYREKNPTNDIPYCINNVISLTNIHHECSALKELAKMTLT